MTFFLQIISLATTYSGSKVYFGGIKLPLNLSAPFLFALSVQLIVFVLSNSLKRNLRTGLIIILLAATICSTYFSYIGIYNYVNSPIMYLEENYNQIYHNMTDKYTSAVDNSKNQMKQYVFDITGKLQKEYTALATQNDNYNKLSDQVAKISINSNVVSANIGNVIKPNINNYGNNLDKYYEDMAKYNNAILNIAGQAASQNSSAQAAIYDNKVKSLLGGKTLEEFNKEHSDLQANKQSVETLISSMYTDIPNKGATQFDEKLNELQQYCINYIDSKSGEKEKFNSILTNMFTVYSDVTSTEAPKGLGKDLNMFFTATDDTQTFMRSLGDVEKNVYSENYGKNANGNLSLSLSDALLLYSKLQSEIENGAYLLNSISSSGIVIDLKNDEYTLENMYVLPVKNLFYKGSTLGIAWFCLSFAALIDGLTLLFALVSSHKGQVLVAKKSKDLVRNSEELTEEMILSSLLLSPRRDNNKSSIQYCLEHLAKFLCSFKFTDIGIDEGFSLYCRLNELTEFQILLSVLCQFNLARILSNEDFELLKATPTLADFEHFIETENSPEALEEVAAANFKSESESYVLLKTKFVIWVNQKLAIASSDRKLSVILNDILKNLEENERIN